MAKSKYEYVKTFEQDPSLLPNTWVVIRIDGKGFTKFTSDHHYSKPNDPRGLSLMSKAASEVCKSVPGFVLAYGQSDEYSLVLHKDSNLYSRRLQKIITTVVAEFAAAFVMYWREWFDLPMVRAPSFDARAVMYPSEDTLMDYLRWRQADCHINNLYNTCFWKLVESGETEGNAHLRLKGTTSSEKNELLYTNFTLNYNSEPEQYRKGTTLLRPYWNPVYVDLFPAQFYVDNGVFLMHVESVRAETPFDAFVAARKGAVAEENQGLDERGLMKLLNAEWKSLPAASKASFSPS